MCHSPILHRGYSSSNSRAGSISSMQAEAHVSRLAHDFVAEKRASAPPSVEHSPITTGAIEAIRHIAGDIREITTSTTLNVGMTRRDRPQHMMPPPASPSTPTQDLVASTSAQGRAHVSTIALVKIGGSLESAAASPTGALTTNQVNAPSIDPVANTANPTTTSSLAVTNKLSAPRAPPSRSPSPSDPQDAHSWPAPAAAPAPRAQPLVAPFHTPPAHMTSDSAYDGHLPSLEPRSPPRTRVLEELYALRAENAKLRAAEQEREREGAALAAEVGNLERELQEKTAACETLENTVLDLKNARDVLQAELHQAKREVANGASMYGHALQKMEAMQIEASQREEAFMAQMEQLREDLRETLDFAQTEASTSQRMIDILTAELTMLRAERRSEAHQRKTSSRASIAEGTSHAPNVSGIISSSSSSTVAAPTEEVTAQNSSSEGSSLASSLRRDLLGPTGEVDANQPHDDSLVAALLATPPRDEDSERDRSCMETPSDDVSIVIVSPENPHDDPGDTKVTDVVAHIHLSPMYHVSPPRAIEPRVPGGSFDLGSPNSQSTHSQFTLGSFSVAPMMPMVEVGYSTTATQTRIPIVADAHIGVSLSLDPDTSLLHNSPAGGVDKAALDAIMSPQGDDQRVDKLNAELAETRTRATEATQQWAKWVEQCAKTNAVLAKERQFREALELEHDKLKGFVTAFPSTMDGSASVVGLYTEADLRRAVDAARDESLHLAAEVAEFCMQVLEDVKAGRRAL